MARQQGHRHSPETIAKLRAAAVGNVRGLANLRLGQCPAPDVLQRRGMARRRQFSPQEDALIISGKLLGLLGLPWAMIGWRVGCGPEPVRRRAAELAQQWLPPGAVWPRRVLKADRSSHTNG